MKDYICCDCNTMFDEDEADFYYEDPSPSGVGLPAGREMYLCCPNCGSADYDDVRCDEDCEECRHAKYCDYREEQNEG